MHVLERIATLITDKFSWKSEKKAEEEARYKIGMKGSIQLLVELNDNADGRFH